MSKHRVFSVVLSLLLMLVPMALSASADEYTDMFDQLFADMEANPDAVRELSAELVFYDEEEVFAVYDGNRTTVRIIANIPPNFVTSSTVSLAARDNYVLTRNGETVEDPDMTALTTPGNYILQCYTEDGTPTVSYEFTIVSPSQPVTSCYYLELPVGMEFSFVTLDGKDITRTENINQLIMESEGVYQIEYTVRDTEYYRTVKLITDHTPPTLLLPEVKDSLAASAVSLEDFNASEASIEILFNGEPHFLPFEKVLTEPGNYKITISDAAGNSSYYEFTIRMYFTVSSWMVILCLVGVVVAVAVFVVKTRRNMRVR